MFKRMVCWGNAALGRGMPVIAVPVMGEKTLGTMAAQAAQSGADVIELRMDSLAPLPTLRQAEAAVQAVREACALPILLTLRTARDGGPGSDDAAGYEALLCRAAGLCEAVDVELSVGEAAFARIARAAHAAGASVVGSSHDFGGTPTVAEMADRLSRMEALGADVCKIAVMPHAPSDVRALEAACARANETIAAPIIAIAMGEMGAATRVCAEAMGSCLTFGTAGQASAPGQMDVRALRAALEAVHRELQAAYARD